jgi:acylphosphatase
LKLVRAHVVISGVVQGVFFRANTMEKARELGLKGWVRNIDDNVEAVFEGEEEKVKKILDFCQRGPSGAKVEKIETKFYDYKGDFEDFKII